MSVNCRLRSKFTSAVKMSGVHVHWLWKRLENFEKETDTSRCPWNWTELFKNCVWLQLICYLTTGPNLAPGGLVRPCPQLPVELANLSWSAHLWVQKNNAIEAEHFSPQTSGSMTVAASIFLDTVYGFSSKSSMNAHTDTAHRAGDGVCSTYTQILQFLSLWEAP